jgi:hypothetical protein
VTWAQRSSSSDPEKNYVYLTIVAADVPESDMKLDLKETSLSFKGPSTSKKVTYAIDIDFYAEIDPKESKISHSGRDVSLVLRKKELKEEYWPRLLKDSKKVHYLKTDFDKVSLTLHSIPLAHRYNGGFFCRKTLTMTSGSMRMSKTRRPRRTTRTR